MSPVGHAGHSGRRKQAAVVDFSRQALRVRALHLCATTGRGRAELVHYATKYRGLGALDRRGIGQTAGWPANCLGRGTAKPGMTIGHDRRLGVLTRPASQLWEEGA
jgi:hypothetical protein